MPIFPHLHFLIFRFQYLHISTQLVSVWQWDGLFDFWRLAPLSAIFQLYDGDQF